MQIIENKKLSEILGTTSTDIINSILELVVASIEDNQTFILWDRKINISVSEIE